MKLVNKITLYYLGIAIIVFSIGGVITYDLISEEISKETDYYMARSLETIEKRLARAVDRGWDISRYNSNQLQIKPLAEGPASEKITFSDTVAMHPHLNQLETMRKLQVIREVEGKFFEISMIDVIVEDSDIYESVVKIITRLFALLALALIIGSILVARGLLKPFKETLTEVQNFNVQDNKELALPKTRTKEFSQLNEFLNQMTSKAQHEYQALKKFSEDASHEIQTPLAIARGKLELLIDSGDLKEDQYKLISGAQAALAKLSQLGRSLTLLTKIENEEFSKEQPTNLSKMIAESVDYFRELCTMKNLDLQEEIEKDVKIPLNTQLGSILLNNLLHNAIKHNFEGGYVRVKLDHQGLQINNSGLPPSSPIDRLFNRFEKGSDNGDSSGLGLAIVKEICDYHRMGIHYTYENDHQIRIIFSPNGQS